MKKIRILLWKAWNSYQLNKLSDTRAAMHTVKFISREKLQDQNQKYKWVIITKEI